jgi:prepilin-type N-terminal cleavage/methylation domain-containing protein
MKRQKGFTLLELLVVSGMIAMLAALTIPTLSRARDLVKRTKCRSNLHSIGIALSTAANEDSTKRYPHVSTGQDVWDKIGYDKTAGYDPTGVQDGTRPLFLLIARTRKTAADVWVREEINLVKPDIFLCPGVSGVDTVVDDVDWSTGTNEQVGFESSASIHYSYQHSINLATPVLTMIDDPKRIIMADRSPLATYPGTQVGYNGGEPDADSYDTLGASTADDNENSPNHNGEGQAVLRKGGDVRWSDVTTFDHDIVTGPDHIWQANEVDTGAIIADRAGAAPSFDPGRRVPDIFLVP